MRFLRIIPFVVLLFCLACSGQQRQPVTLSTDSTGMVSLALDQELILRLSSNQTTGYRWRTTKTPAMLQQVGEATYTPGAASSGMVGVEGTEEWRFKAAARGTGILELVYQRPGDKGPAKKRFYTISVW